MKGDSMQLLSGVNHVAVLTADLDRFVDFYVDVFEVEVIFRETTPELRHAIVRTGPGSWLHPVEVADNPHAQADGEMFDRGHLDHLALTAASPDAFDRLRSRLVERDATNGDVDDLGAFHSLWFEDPDGMRVELVVLVDANLAGIHEPRPLVDTTT
jgi:catechol 2,3-dioxygenase-like lactoylglutathione lyase family enzyme